MGASKVRSLGRGVFAIAWLVLVPAAANGQDGEPALREAVQLHFSAGDLTAARELSVLVGDYAVATQNLAAAAQAYLDAAWIAIEEAKRFDHQVRHPYLAALRYGVTARYEALDRRRAQLVEEAKRLTGQARGLAQSTAIGAAERERILGRVDALAAIAALGTSAPSE